MACARSNSSCQLQVDANRDLDPSHADPDQGPQFQQLQPNCPAGGPGELRASQADAAQRTEQDIVRRGEPRPQLVGLHRRRRGAVREQREHKRRVTLSSPVTGNLVRGRFASGCSNQVR